MARHRFRFFGIQQSEHLWLIEGDEATHLAKVLKLSAGNEIEVTDGKGTWVVGEIQSQPSQKGINVVPKEITQQAKPASINLAIGALKTSSFDEILPALVELGVSEIHVFLQEKTDKKRISTKIETRWKRIIIGALKQSKRAWIPTIHTHKSLNGYLEHVNNTSVDTHRIMLDATATESLNEIPLPAHKPIELILGSEMGLDKQESELLLTEGYHSARIGPHILRATTAAVASMAIVSAKIG